MTPKQQKALAALMVAPNRKEAAKMAGITDRTMREYMSDPEFREAYRAAFMAVVEDATRQGQNLLRNVFQVFEDVMNNPDESGATRVTAAKSAAEYTLRLTDQTDIKAELEELRRAVFPDEH